MRVGRCAAAACFAVWVPACSARDARHDERTDASSIRIAERAIRDDALLRARLAARSEPPRHVSFASHADEATRVGLVASAPLHVSLAGASPAALRVDGGRAFYANAFPSTDAIVAADDSSVEWMFVLRDLKHGDLALDVELPPELPEARIDALGTIVFVDRAGTPRLRVPPAYAIDADGIRREARLDWRPVTHRLEVHLDTAGLRAPVVLDPAIETAAWNLVHPGNRPALGHVRAANLGGKLVVVTTGKVANTPNLDLWEWDGATWTLRAPAHAPPLRVDFAMAANSSKIVLFGGRVGTTLRDDTWEWDGVDWTQRTPAKSPSPRSAHAMANRSGKIVLFGGSDAAGANDETWEWDGTTWTQAAPTTKPAARYDHAMSSYGANVMMLGGNVGADETWEWTGTNWINRTPSPAPMNISKHSLAEVGGVVYAAGGYGGFAWQWTGTTWTSFGLPSMLERPGLAPFAGKLHWFGGWPGPGTADVFAVLDAGTWTNVTIASPVPSARETAPMAARSSTSGDRLVLFGGEDAQGTQLDETHQFDGTTWTKMSPANKPAARTYHATASLGDKVVLFGGLSGGSTALGDTWEWNGVDWTRRTTSSAPAPRYMHAMTGFGGKALLYGGVTSVLSNETWEWDGTSWTQRTSTTTPGGRARHRMGATSTFALLFGSDTPSGAWTWDGTNWSHPSVSGAPEFTFPGVAGQGGKIVTFGGAAPMGENPFDQTWVYDGSIWKEKVFALHPAGRSRHAFASLGKRVYLFGGRDGTIGPRPFLFDDTWSLLISTSNGGPCKENLDCDSGFCVDSVCCDKACDGACEACSATAKGSGEDGVCGPVAAGTDPRERCKDDGAPKCALDGTCDGAGACRSYGTSPGCTPRACTADVECASGFCVDGICCDKRCNGPCEACRKALKGGGEDGVCGAVAAGTDPRDRCALDPGYPASCKADGFCDGAGACRAFAVSGTACGAASCTAGVVTGPKCNGSGVCATADVSCAPYACSAGGTACATTCSVDADCDATAYCDTGTCKAKKANGLLADRTAECASGVVADGVCCNTGCTGVCESCDAMGTRGTCTAVKGAPRHGSCPTATGADPCGSASCDGDVRDTCKALAGPDVVCRFASCVEGVEIGEAKCEGTGKCPAIKSRKCAPYGCGDVSCKATCASDSDCASGNRCDTSSGTCIGGATCVSEGLVSIGKDGVIRSCTPYRCGGDGLCATACGGSSECAPGFVCDVPSKTCVSGQTDGGDGGGCSLGRRGVRGEAVAATVGLLVLLASRRRVRRPRS